MQLEPLGERTKIHGVEFVRVPVLHGEMEISGFRFGNAAYLTDVSAIPESSFALLEGLEHLVLSALRHKPHPSHATRGAGAGLGAAHRRTAHLAYPHRPRTGPRRDQPHAAGQRQAGLRRADDSRERGPVTPMSDSPRAD